MTLMPPVTMKVNVEEDYHGVSICDHFRWLEDADSGETASWVSAQREYCKEFICAYSTRSHFRSRVCELLQRPWMGVPRRRGDTFLAMVRLAGESRSSLWQLDENAKPIKRLIDPQNVSSNNEASISLADISHDGRVLAYSLRTGGADEVEVRFVSVCSPSVVTHTLQLGRYSGIQLSKDGQAAWVSRYTANGPRVFAVDLAGGGCEHEVFGSAFGAGDMIGIELNSDETYLLVTVWHGSSGDHSEVYLLPLHAPFQVKAVVNDIHALFDAEFAGDNIVIRTRWDAPNGRVMCANIEQPSREHWREVVPERDCPIQSLSAVGGALFLVRLDGSACSLERWSLEGGTPTLVELPGRGTTTAPQGEWGGQYSYLSYTSWFMPSTTYCMNNESCVLTALGDSDLGYDPNDFVVTDTSYASFDGTVVPISVLSKRGTAFDGTAPTILTAYGGFNISVTPSYAPGTISWLEQGGVYAVANIRGGGEFGEAWHVAGMRGHKQNVFDDFAAAANWLVEARLTSHERLAIRGGSNGGLLVGALITQWPQICAVAVCGVPLLDMLRYHKFLVARFWIPEYGSSDDPEQFRWLHSYSPYHKVQSNVQYPAVLFVTGEKDTRVDPLHARKMTAALQMANNAKYGRPVLLHYEAEGGHSAGRPTEAEADVTADTLAFIYHELMEPRTAMGTFVEARASV